MQSEYRKNKLAMKALAPLIRKEISDSLKRAYQTNKVKIE